jgi:hypothetical protein
MWTFYHADMYKSILPAHLEEQSLPGHIHSWWEGVGRLGGRTGHVIAECGTVTARESCVRFAPASVDQASHRVLPFHGDRRRAPISIVTLLVAFAGLTTATWWETLGFLDTIRTRGRALNNMVSDEQHLQQQTTLRVKTSGALSSIPRREESREASPWSTSRRSTSKISKHYTMGWE